MALLSKEEEKLGQQLAKTLAHELLALGHITEEDLSDRKKLFERINERLSDGEISITIDHRDTILDAARDFSRKKKYDFAIIFYAMYFEHTINSLIKHAVKKKDFEQK